MANTIPNFTRAIDNAFVETWYEIRPEAIDNILLATPIWAALKTKGCFVTQVGSEIITRTVKYATAAPLVDAVVKGDTLPMGEVETETMAQWRWRNLVAGVQRSTLQDQANAGKFQIKSYVAKRLKEAREALQQQQEVDIYRAEDTTETAHKHIQSLNDIVPAFANVDQGTYGLIARSNTWWRAIFKQLTLPKEVNLLSDMKVLYNSIGLNLEYPDLVVASRDLYEMYEEFALDQAQIVKGTGDLADLGFETLKFKGNDMIWSPNITSGELCMYNTNYIEAVYDPNYWFEMSEWKPIPNQFERVAHILAVCNVISAQPRRHGRLYN